MTQSLAITDYLDSLAEAKTRFGLSYRAYAMFLKLDR